MYCRTCKKPEAQASWKARNRAQEPKKTTGEEVLAQCWCTANYVYVDPAVVLAGKTGSCVNSFCNEEWYEKNKRSTK